MFPRGTTGEQIEVHGNVLSVDGKPIAGATIHVWVADPTGRYDNQDDAGNPLSIPANKQRFRGRLFSTYAGSYTFKCLRPGNYYDDGWKLWRPAHIHIKIEAPGYETLETQLYFQDDAQNKHDIPGDDFFQPELCLHLSPAIPAQGGTQRSIFNFVLKAK